MCGERGIAVSELWTHLETQLTQRTQLTTLLGLELGNAT